MKRFAVVLEPLDPRAIEGLVQHPGSGGIVTFTGIVRDSSEDGRPVEGLFYEAHREMAESEFERIGGEAGARFGPCEIAVHHRVGALAIGEVAVVVSVAAKHRGAAFDACHYVINELKKRAPIWKQECYTGGGSQWNANDRFGKAQ